MPPPIAPDVVGRLYGRADASRWSLDPSEFGDALALAAGRTFGDRQPDEQELERALAGLHLEDLALARACAAGHAEAWEHLIATHRPLLYRMADGLEPGGGARELADALWADLYGADNRDGRRRSLLCSFLGRSSLATWLRSVLAQRHVDRFRTSRRASPLPDEDSPHALRAPSSPAHPRRERYVDLMRQALSASLASLAPRERLRLRCYYAERLTLAETGRVTGEHEATVSRQLARSRQLVRQAVARFLAAEGRLDPAQISECFASVAADTGPLDLTDLLGGRGERKKSSFDRSEEEQTR